MTIEIDARGLACPQPVIQTRKAMQRAEKVVTLVDSETSLTNVTRMAAKAGWQADVTSDGHEYRIELVRGDAPLEAVSSSQAAPLPVGKAEALGGPLVLVVPANTMGRGNAELGNILVRAFFHTLGEVEPSPGKIVFFNSGVELACEGSPVLDDLCALEEEGIEMLVCGTCLGYFELKDKLRAGVVSNMYDIAETMLGAGKVVSL